MDYDTLLDTQYTLIVEAFDLDNDAPSVALQKAAMYTFVAAQKLKGVRKPVSNWKELGAFIQSISRQEGIDMIKLVRDKGDELRMEEKEGLKIMYSCIKEPSNIILHKMLTEVYGPINLGDKKKLAAPLEGEGN